MAEEASPIGRRVHVVGNSCSGKTTLGARLAAALDVPLVEIDALNWQPGWVGLHATAPDELRRRLDLATPKSGFVAAGYYLGYAQRAFWSRLDTVVWLDLPLVPLLARVVVRSWRRWRTAELLWGTNRESFWSQFALWRGRESLLFWIVTEHAKKRRRLRSCRADPRWAGIRFVRLASVARIESFARAVEGALEDARGSRVRERSPAERPIPPAVR